MLTCTAVACPLSAVVLAGCRRPPFSRQPMCGGSSALRRACPQPGEVWHELDSVQREAAAGRGSRSRPCCGSAVCKKRRGCAAARHCCRRGRAGRSASPGRVRRHSRGAALPAERGRGQRGRGAAARRAASVQIGSSLQVINVPLDWPSATSSTLTGSRGRSPATRTSRSRRDCSQRSPMACSARSARRPRTFRTCKRRRRPNSGGPLLDANGRVVGILIAGSGDPSTGQTVPGEQFALPSAVVARLLAAHGVRAVASPVTTQYAAALQDYGRGYYTWALAGLPARTGCLSPAQASVRCPVRPAGAPADRSPPRPRGPTASGWQLSSCG